MAQVIFRNVIKRYGNNVETIKGVNLEVKDKEFIILVGPSGCGKSTLLRMVAGLEDITSGELLIGDRVVNNIEPKDRDIAMVFQNYALYPHKTIYDNMAFGLRMLKTPKDIIDERVQKAAKILHIDGVLNRKPKELSGGQRQRVALGRAIVREPSVFLMDEPLSNLDAKLRVQMRAELSRLHKDLQTTIIYVTHDQVEAMTMGDRIVILNKGVVQQFDTPKAIYDKPNNMFVAGFVGSPAMNFIHGIVDSNGRFETGVSSFLLNENLFNVVQRNGFVDKAIVLGIRPENFCEKVNQNECQAYIKVNIDLVEMLGSEKLLHFRLKEEQLTAKIHPDHDIYGGEDILLELELDKCVLFDPETTTRLR